MSDEGECSVCHKVFPTEQIKLAYAYVRKMEWPVILEGEGVFCLECASLIQVPAEPSFGFSKAPSTTEK